MSKMTIRQYAIVLGVERDTIHKRMKAMKDRGEKIKLEGVTKIEMIGNVNILYVNDAALKAIKQE